MGGFPLGVVRTGLALATLAGVLLVASTAAASPPCATLQYAVSSSGVRCNVTVQNDPSLALTDLWWANASSGGYDPASGHVNRTATSAEPVTYLDVDGNEIVSQGDRIEVYTGNGCGGSLLVVFGPDPSSASGSQALLLQNGYQTSCPSGSADSTGTLVAIAAVVAAVGLLAGFVLIRRLRR